MNENMNEIETLLDELCAVAAKRTRAEIDASTCGTSADFRRARMAEIEFENNKDVAIQRIAKMIKEGSR